MIKRLIKAFAFVGLAFAALFSNKASAGEGREGPAPAAKPRYRKWLLRVAAIGLAMAAAGLLVAVSGMASIKASSGHWPITRWFLNFSKERSVATHSLGVKPPSALNEMRRILKGAGHYDMGCRPCHGSPGSQPRIPRHMLPTPPALGPQVARWQPRELFYIVKHGIKLTGMPAWPAPLRDDEIWDVVAFLQELPEMTPLEYRQLARGETAPDQGAPMEDLDMPESIREIMTESCARCHGTDGLSRGAGAFPRLAGQTMEYLQASLQAYASGTRHSGIMEPIAAGLDEPAIRELARYYSGLPPGQPRPFSAGQASSINRGRKIAAEGIPAQRVAACSQCHGPSRTPRNPAYPLLAGQYPEYLVLQLELFGKRSRGGAEYSHLMHFTADGLTPEQRQDVARYYASSSAALEDVSDER